MQNKVCKNKKPRKLIVSDAQRDKAVKTSNGGDRSNDDRTTLRYGGLANRGNGRSVNRSTNVTTRKAVNTRQPRVAQQQPQVQAQAAPNNPEQAESVSKVEEILAQPQPSAIPDVFEEFSEPEPKPTKKIKIFKPRLRFAERFRRESVLYSVSAIVLVFGLAGATYGFVEKSKADDIVADIVGRDGEVQGVTTGAPDQANLVDTPDETPVEQGALAAHMVPVANPRYLRISEIDLNARVVRLGQTEEGAIDTPRNISDVGWYERSARTGTNDGVVVLVAHQGGPTQHGVFAELNDLRIDDVVEIEQGNGSIHRFAVVEMAAYDNQLIDMERALAPVDPEKLGLNLITSANDDDNKPSLLVRAVKI